VEDVAKGGKYLFPASRQFMAFETVKEDGFAFWCKKSSQNARAETEYVAVLSEE
jgi:hypothetical protein